MLAFAEHHPLLVFGLLVAFSILTSVARTFLGLLSGKPARQHGRVVVDYVQKHGYQLLNPVLAQKLDASVLDMVKDPRCTISRARRPTSPTSADSTTAAMTGWPSAASSGTGRSPSSTSARRRRFTAAVAPYPSESRRSRSTGYLASPSSPARRHGRGDRGRKLLHQPESTIELDPGQHASFGSRYRLRGADRTAVVEFFTPERIRFIEAEQLPGKFASNARYLVYYESTAMRTEADYDAFMAVVERIATRFL